MSSWLMQVVEFGILAYVSLFSVVWACWCSWRLMLERADYANLFMRYKESQAERRLLQAELEILRRRTSNRLEASDT